VANGWGQDLVVRVNLSRFQGRIFYNYDHVIRPNYEIARYSNRWVSIPASNVPRENMTLAVDVELFNTWGDLVCKARTLHELRYR
jgi:hypothetical protein